MTLLHRRPRAAAALAALAAAVPFAASASANAAPLRTVDGTKYTSALYLQHALGLPASETNPAIESVTYDRFQWLLQQSGQYALLIGDPATDATFKQRAQDVEAAADAAGVKDVYWFNPNLSGNAQVGGITEKRLDIRQASTAEGLVEASQKRFETAWLNLVSKYLGNGVSTATVSNVFTATKGDAAAVKNDQGGAEVGNPSSGVLFDYPAVSSVPANVSDSYFIVYDRDRKAGADQQKLAAWVDLTKNASSADAKADFTAALNTVGGASAIDAQSEFAWWKDSNNTKQANASSDITGKDVPVTADADNDPLEGGWRIHQVTYPELAFLLKTVTDKDAVLLFGGTWCPNTRPVIQSINRNAQLNDVTVFNFDTILDGGTIGGNSSSNPLQSRNTSGNNAASTANNTPTWLYADLVKQYLGNIKTEYDPAGNSPVTYYPGGDLNKPLTRINKLQVPFVVGYRGKAGDEPHGGATRQWIIDKGNNTYTEYMTAHHWTKPQPFQLNISNIPKAVPYWTKLNAQIKDLTFKTDPASIYTNTATDADALEFLAAGDKADVTTTAPVAVTLKADGAVAVGPAELTAALNALGASAPANLNAAKDALVAAAAGSDAALTANLKTVVGAWGVALVRKNRVNTVIGNATNPNSVAGGIASLRALDVFFGGLPGGVVSTQTVSADSVDSATAAKVTIAIANEFDRTPAGNVQLVAKNGDTTVATLSAAVSGGTATFTLPVLPAATYGLTLSYAGDDQIAAFTKTASLTVTQAPDAGTKTGTETKTDTKPTETKPADTKPTGTVLVKVKAPKLAGSVAKAPTKSKIGKYKVAVTAASGRAAATGKVTVVLKKGKSKKTLTGTLVNGVVTVTVPKLAKGTWKVTLSWTGDANHLAASAAGAAVKVKK